MDKYDPNDQELEDLLRQVDALLEEEAPEEDWSDDMDLEEYAPPEVREEEPVLYQNYSNEYGKAVKNYSNGYGGKGIPTQYSGSEISIPAYNADFQDHRDSGRKTEYRELLREPEPPEEKAPKQPKAPKAPKAPKVPKERKARKKRGCGCGCATVLVALVLAVMAVFSWVFQMPQAESSIGDRKRDTATILICGTDASGDRTDTMMLLYLSGSEKQVGLLSLPRDSYTIATAGYAAKLNSAYGRNNGGTEGMEALLDYVQDIIGYRPDGYVLVDFNLVPQIVDLMGGVEVEVPVDMETSGVYLEAGLQRLNGEQVLALLRHRKSYAMADLTRVEVQRSVIKACMEQWVSVDNVSKVGDALKLVEENSLTSLGTRNYLWVGKTLLKSLGNGFVTETLPGWPEYIDGVSYYLLDRSGVAELINESFNPYAVEIEAANLNIAG